MPEFRVIARSEATKQSPEGYNGVTTPSLPPLSSRQGGVGEVSPEGDGRGKSRRTALPEFRVIARSEATKQSHGSKGGATTLL
jgi:hypothetical protein